MVGEYDVFFYEAFAEEAELMKHFIVEKAPHVKAGFTVKTIQEYGAQEPPAAIISTRTQSVIPTAWAPKLTGILTRSTGYDHIRRYLRSAGVAVPSCYLPKYCARSVAEQALTLWMACLRKLPIQTRQFKTFDRDGLTGNECFKKTLLVVGVGNIGSEICRIGQGLGMRVLGVDIVKRYQDLVQYVDYEAGAKQADLIVCAMSLTDLNYGYFNATTLSQAPRGVTFVNVSRGELSPSADLAALLEEGHLAAVGLDVYQEEQALGCALREGIADKLEPGTPAHAAWRLAQHPRAILTPHNAFNTAEATSEKTRQSVEAVAHFLAHGAWPAYQGKVVA